MSTLNKTNRRDFLKITSLTGSGLVLGFSWFGSESAPVVLSNTAVAADLNFNSYLSNVPDVTNTILSPNPELDEIITPFLPITEDEMLDADWSKVKVLQAPV